MATFALDTTGRTSDEVFTLHRACERFDRPGVVSVRGVWHDGEEPYVLLTLDSGATERIELELIEKRFVRAA
jgi:hypothetical protein